MWREAKWPYAVHPSLDGAVWVLPLAKELYYMIVCSWATYFPLTAPLPSQVYKWILEGNALNSFNVIIYLC